MEKRNVVTAKRTPCKKKQDKEAFCDCGSCKCAGEKKSSEKVTDINDIDGLARMHR